MKHEELHNTNEGVVMNLQEFVNLVTKNLADLSTFCKHQMEFNSNLTDTIVKLEKICSSQSAQLLELQYKLSEIESGEYYTLVGEKKK